MRCAKNKAYTSHAKQTLSNFTLRLSYPKKSCGEPLLDNMSEVQEDTYKDVLYINCHIQVSHVSVVQSDIISFIAYLLQTGSAIMDVHTLLKGLAGLA